MGEFLTLEQLTHMETQTRKGLIQFPYRPGIVADRLALSDISYTLGELSYHEGLDQRQLSLEASEKRIVNLSEQLEIEKRRAALIRLAISCEVPIVTLVLPSGRKIGIDVPSLAEAVSSGTKDIKPARLLEGEGSF
jgi:hypothetical protein